MIKTHLLVIEEVNITVFPQHGMPVLAAVVEHLTFLGLGDPATSTVAG